MSQNILPVFSKLWHNDPAVRIQSSAQLVGHLETAQKAATAVATNQNATANVEAAGPSQQQQLLDDGLASDVGYTLKRLIRGLASPRESSRLGFAVALTELLSRIPDILPRQVFPLLMNSSQLGQGSKGQEERDLLFAGLFGIHAVIASGLIFRPQSSLHDWRVATEEVHHLGEFKPWLRESAGWVLHGATKQLLRRNDVEWKDDAIKALVEYTFRRDGGVASKEWTPEKLALALLLQAADVKADWDTLTKPAFKQSSLMASSGNLPVIARILKGLSIDETSKKANEQAQSAYLGSGQLHYVWYEILNLYFGSGDLETGSRSGKKVKLANGASARYATDVVPFLDFYKSVVENNLVTESSSISTKYIGMMAFRACMERASADLVPQLFTPNILRTLINHLAKGDRTLHGVSLSIVKAIPTVLQRVPEASFDTLLTLYRGPVGTIRFDTITRSKTSENVVASLDSAGIKKYSAWLMQLIVDGKLPGSSDDLVEEAENDMDVDEDEDANAKETDRRRSWAIDQLLLLVRKHAKPLTAEATKAPLSMAEHSWVWTILQFLLVNGFFNVLKATKKSEFEALRYKPEAPFSAATQQVFRARFFSALSHLIANNGKCRGEVWSKQSLETLLALQKDIKHVTPLTSIEDAQETQEVVRLLPRIHKDADDQKSQYLALLVEIVLLMAYDPDGDAQIYLEQLHDGVEALLTGASTGSKPSTSNEAADDSDDGEEAEPISILIDFLLNLMQKSSVLLRTVSERVFAAASGQIGEQALQLLLGQIIPEDIELVEDTDSDSEVDDQEASSHKANGKKGITDASDEDEDEDDEDDDEDDDEEGDLELEVDEELRAKILDALKESGVEDEEEEEAEEEDDEEELLDDDQMMELDDKLAEIFRARKSASRSAKDEQQATHDAQLKVIDLLEIFAKQQSSNSLLLQLIMPLFNAGRRSGKEDRDVASKARKVLNGIVTKYKDLPSTVDSEQGAAVLRELHASAAKADPEEIEGLAIASSLYLCKIILAGQHANNAAIVIDVYTSSLNSYLLKKSCRLRGRFFEAFIQRHREVAWDLRNQLLAACSEATVTKDKHRRSTCFHLLSALCSTHASLKTSQAKQQTIDFMHEYVQIFMETFKAAAAGNGMSLPVARLREIIKACSEAIRSTRSALKGGPSVEVWDVWRTVELSAVFAGLSQSPHVEKAGSLTSDIRRLLDLVNQGSGRAKSRHVEEGEPPLLPKDSNGKSLTKLDQRQVKKEQKREQKLAESQRKAATVKEKQKKRKASAVEEQEAIAVEEAEAYTASTSEDSDV